MTATTSQVDGYVRHVNERARNKECRCGADVAWGHYADGDHFSDRHPTSCDVCLANYPGTVNSGFVLLECVKGEATITGPHTCQYTLAKRRAKFANRNNATITTIGAPGTVADTGPVTVTEPATKPAPLTVQPVPVVNHNDGLEAARRALGIDLDGMTKAVISAAEATIDRKLASLEMPTVKVTYPDERQPKVVNGTHQRFQYVLNLLLEGRNPYLHGPAGSGKGTLAEQLAEALDVPFVIIRCTPQTSESKLFGGTNVNGEPFDGVFMTGLKSDALIFFDEFDTLGEQVQASVNDIIARRKYQAPGETEWRQFKGYVVAAGNTLATGANREYNSRRKLDRATIDRFAPVPVDYDERLEDAIMAAVKADATIKAQVVALVRALRTNAKSKGLDGSFGIRAMQDMVAMAKCGAPATEVLARVSNGMSAKDWAAITEGVSLPRSF